MKDRGHELRRQESNYIRKKGAHFCHGRKLIRGKNGISRNSLKSSVFRPGAFSSVPKHPFTYKYIHIVHMYVYAHHDFINRNRSSRLNRIGSAE